MRPPGQPFLGAIVVRATILWVGLRFAMAYLGVTSFTPLAVLFMVGAVTAALLLDARLRHEDLLLANLGRSRWSIGLVAGAWTAVLEAGALTVLGMAT